MSIQAIAWAKKQKTGSPTMKAVLVAICDYADERGMAWPSQKRIADDTELNIKSVRTALQKLHALGIICRDGRIISLCLGRETPVIKLGSPRRSMKRERRNSILKRFNSTCVYCGNTSGPFHIDHVIPRSRGGSNRRENLVCACAPCNLAKRDRTPEEWRAA